ncbi:Antitoxin VapB [Thiorhodovibrio winogradskyi]|uniref:Antitoxin VapB n=1 Tax=Thiorhodovibrio winogradskyi TaxID=77007 RepID=A0ABZ0S1Y5_9GAMM|nr:type II toxin-antitoxin system VapB family antitoxin [Thiorhodovibrio winogradskyi]
MERVSIFKSNKGQALRLPKPVAYPETVKQVDIVIQGRARIIIPAGESWDTWFDDDGVSEDFMASREQPGHQERESL